jgi:hypothetical protein
MDLHIFSPHLYEKVVHSMPFVHLCARARAYIYMYVCTYECMYVCKYACMHVRGLFGM